ncbi:MAG TPA: penicillin-binding protein 2, partial [Nocardioidaceae bacterium]|nr:penicillin-binding protein 2 [Nocardioidaceae bacterium]
MSVIRLRVGFILIAMVISLFAVRLLQLQGLDAATYAAKARAVGVVNEVLPATRGSITDRSGRPLAESLDGLMIVADPTKTEKHAREIAKIIAAELDADYFKLLTALRKPDTHFQYLARRVPSTKANHVVELLEDAGFEGIDTRRDPVRTYPAHDVAANIVGFTNAEGQAGEGAELVFDRLLAGKDGSATFEVGGGNRLPLGDNSVVQPVNGDNIALTIDQDVQWYTQRVLRDTLLKARAEQGSAVALDVRTGEVLALADYPTFDANLSTESPEEDLGSRALRDVYEPGSVQKVLTISSLLDAGKVTPRTPVVVPESLPSSDSSIKDWFPHGKIHLTMTGVLAKSSNIGTVLAARQLRSQELYERLTDFGLGSRTGVGMKGESSGILPHWSGWREINKDTVAFGQGLAVNVLQMAAAVNVIANDGVYVQPSLLKGRAAMNDGTVVGSDVAESHRVISSAAARQTALMMEMVTDLEEGTAPSAAIEGYRVAGKTGTAQQPGGACHCYSQGPFTVSFAGFAPADDPRFLVYVVVHDPYSGGGGSVGGPAFHKIISFLLSKYAVPPTGV